MLIAKFSRSIFTASLLAVSLAAHAEFPDRPITLVNPFPNGGATDRVGRIFAPKVSEILGQAVIIESRPGAGSVIGNAYVAKARPDGYTLLISQIGLASNASLMKNLPYDARKDFQPIAGMADAPGLILAPTSAPFDTFQEFTAYAKANPGKVTYGTTGAGTWPDLGMASLAIEAHLPLTPVPYKGTSQVLPDLIAGRVDTMLVSYGSTEGLVKAGKLKILASTTKARAAELPDVPTVAELGYPDYRTSIWVGVVGPAGMPPEIVSKLEHAFMKAGSDPEVVKQLAASHIVPMAIDAKQLGDLQNAEIDKWAKVIKEAGIHVE